ncbi:melanocortin-2 receptor accessory protein 2A-like isoform X2 [Syngnathus acus]|uniref:melanocortin-2 receptor accessory protein 2A-like isoform X2 n=1 Tax=Syngnathus acus TaxID=161584 RepID=UPI001885CFFC|nr:melanocortin-2 receptor accessory protein 2A-like isoform X2 [Syngnathus acus]
MSLHNRSQSSARRSDYEWQYEYYDEEPVSFEGLKAHRYSIVIGFWVGLAVFVIFMFFVLTLLTKTGAPLQDTDTENLPGPGNGLVNIISQKDDTDDITVPRPFLEESCPYFNSYISDGEEAKRWQKPKAKPNGSRGTFNGTGGTTCAVPQQEERLDERKTETDFLPHFNIPNFITFEHNSLGEDDLLCESPITPEENI